MSRSTLQVLFVLVERTSTSCHFGKTRVCRFTKKTLNLLVVQIMRANQAGRNLSDLVKRRSCSGDVHFNAAARSEKSIFIRVLLLLLQVLLLYCLLYVAV